MNAAKNSGTNPMIADDSFFMDRALDLAARGVALASPNPMVGAVLVREGIIIDEGFHTYDVLRHAEIIALDATGRDDKKAAIPSGVLTPERAIDAWRGATLYVNLEPC